MSVGDRAVWFMAEGGEQMVVRLELVNARKRARVRQRVDREEGTVIPSNTGGGIGITTS